MTGNCNKTATKESYYRQGFMTTPEKPLPDTLIKRVAGRFPEGRACLGRKGTPWPPSGPSGVKRYMTHYRAIREYNISRMGHCDIMTAKRN